MAQLINRNSLFSMNVTPSASLDGLSPFNLVFGRRPRLSSKDICFPTKFIPAVIKGIKGPHERYVSRLATNLQDLRFRATDESIEQKEIQRLIHDRKRGSHAAVNFLDSVKRGSIVCVHQPTAGLRKLTFQWSEPVFLVLSVTPSIARVINLVSQEGGKGLFPPTINITAHGIWVRIESMEKKTPEKTIRKNG